MSITDFDLYNVKFASVNKAILILITEDDHRLAFYNYCLINLYLVPISVECYLMAKGLIFSIILYIF